MSALWYTLAAFSAGVHGGFGRLVDQGKTPFVLRASIGAQRFTEAIDEEQPRVSNKNMNMKIINNERRMSRNQLPWSFPIPPVPCSAAA